MWDNDPYSKRFYTLPNKESLLLDWVASYSNGTFKHYAEPIHATEAITNAALDAIRTHHHHQQHLAEHHIARIGESTAAGGIDHISATTIIPSPLFLYVAFTAAHSPLLPLSRHLQACSHLGKASSVSEMGFPDITSRTSGDIFLGENISQLYGNVRDAMPPITHMWRQQFCGMVLGLDEGIANITTAALQYLGTNTVVAVVSDNGGSPWFGGMNYPLRGGKGNPMEGGVRVPAFITDLSPEQRFLGDPTVAVDKDCAAVNTCAVRSFHGLVHASDWMPTLLSLANIPADHIPSRMDGFDLVDALRTKSSYSSFADAINNSRPLITPSLSSK
jgi:hypothetical protein